LMNISTQARFRSREYLSKVPVEGVSSTFSRGEIHNPEMRQAFSLL
jgi:hypothetical protein